MTLPTDFTITRVPVSGTHYQMLLRGCSYDPNKTQIVNQLPFIGLSDTQNLLFRFTGQQKQIQINFTLVNDGVDVSNGTSSSVLTPQAQAKYFMDTVFSAEFDTYWTIQDSVYFTAATSCVITEIRAPEDKGNPSTINGTLTLVIGTLPTLPSWATAILT